MATGGAVDRVEVLRRLLVGLTAGEERDAGYRRRNTALEAGDRLVGNLFRPRAIRSVRVPSLASDEDKKRGVEVGANAYITKSTFDQKVLLETIGRLV